MNPFDFGTDEHDAWERQEAQEADDETTPPDKAPLTFYSIKELRARVQAAGPRKFLLRGYWPHGDYGMLGGDAKAQKTWNTVDVAVSVASGTPWLDLVPVDQAGPVLMFAGEGGEPDILRRIDAVAASRDLAADDLPITVCCRAPHLSDAVHIGLMADQLDRIRPTLTTLDPLYLAARGASLGDLYAMGALLEKPQHMCQEAGSSLWVAHHQNRREGRGASRMSGAGPAEWGRVLISTTVISRHTDPVTHETTVITELDAIGGTIAGGTLRVVRKIRADDPDNLDSLLHYTVTTTEGEAEQVDGNDTGAAPALRKILDAMRSLGKPATIPTITDEIVKRHGHGLRRETMSKHLNALARDGQADSVEAGRDKLWFLIDSAEEEV